jgi:hypothetical protein
MLTKEIEQQIINSDLSPETLAHMFNLRVKTVERLRDSVVKEGHFDVEELGEGCDWITGGRDYK